eukprot:gb/GEZN01011404.1/.p1 GENE.gb/GEZN01011404.1/~~gb/GEZN01011404.1/.p1  ORF type:complete len:196 (-),score=4.10 gb/GEZN01011404.1/:488-1075(-)
MIPIVREKRGLEQNQKHFELGGRRPSLYKTTDKSRACKRTRGTHTPKRRRIVVEGKTVAVKTQRNGGLLNQHEPAPLQLYSPPDPFVYAISPLLSGGSPHWSPPIHQFPTPKSQDMLWIPLSSRLFQHSSPTQVDYQGLSPSSAMSPISLKDYLQNGSPRSWLQWLSWLSPVHQSPRSSARQAHPGKIILLRNSK